jgi:hypothetical protein
MLWFVVHTQALHSNANAMELDLPLAANVRFSRDLLVVDLDDGRIISVPIQWFRRLREATSRQRNNFRFIGGGMGISWPEIDEDLSVAGLLAPQQQVRGRRSA